MQVIQFLGGIDEVVCSYRHSLHDSRQRNLRIIRRANVAAGLPRMRFTLNFKAAARLTNSRSSVTRSIAIHLSKSAEVHRTVDYYKLQVLQQPRRKKTIHCDVSRLQLTAKSELCCNRRAFSVSSQINKQQGTPEQHIAVLGVYSNQHATSVLCNRAVKVQTNNKAPSYCMV